MICDVFLQIFFNKFLIIDTKQIIYAFIPCVYKNDNIKLFESYESKLLSLVIILLVLFSFDLSAQTAATKKPVIKPDSIPGYKTMMIEICCVLVQPYPFL